MSGGIEGLHWGIGKKRVWRPQPRSGPPVGRAFAGFTAAAGVALALVLFVDGSFFTLGRDPSFVGRLGVVAVTLFSASALLSLYRTVSVGARAPLLLALLLFVPAAFWSWLVFVESPVPGRSTTSGVALSSALVGILFLSRGLREARWIEVFGGLAAVDVVLAAGLVNTDTGAAPTLGVASLVVLAGMTALYGVLVDIELAAHASLGAVTESNQRLEGENKRNQELLHDLRSGLLSIEAAVLQSQDQMAGPISSEAARLRRLTVGHGHEGHFDLAQGVRTMVEAKRAAGADLAFSAPDSATVSGDESEVLAIVDNLVSNAQRHGRPPVRVDIRATSDGIELGVADNGEGVHPSLVDKVFERGVSTDPEGSGLGLSRARHLAEQNNAELFLDLTCERSNRFVLSMKPVPEVIGVAEGAAGANG